MSGQTVADGKGSGGSAVLTVGLVEDMGQVMGNRFLAELKLLGNLGVGQPFCRQAEHSYFSCGQSGGIGW